MPIFAQSPWELAQRFLDEPDGQPQRIPFRVHLPDWKAENPGTLQEMVLSSAGILEESLVGKILCNGSGVLLLDSLDEVPAKDRGKLVEWLDEQIEEDAVRHCSFVLASRPWAPGQAPLRSFRTNRLTLMDLSARDIESYLLEYFPDADHAHRLARQLGSAPQIRELAKQPLFLMLLCFISERSEATLPATEGQLLETALRTLLQLRKLPEEASLRLLGRLAWVSWQEESDQLTESQALKSIDNARQEDGIVREARLGPHSEGILRTLCEHSGTLSQVDHTYVFLEETYREYLAGRCIAVQGQDKIAPLFSAHAWNPRWTRVFSYMMTRLWQEDRQLAGGLVRRLLTEADHGHDDVWHTLILLAARLLSPCGRPLNGAEGSLTSDVAHRTLEAWQFTMRNRVGFDLHMATHRALAGLIPAAGQIVMESLLAVLEDDGIGKRAATALGVIATQEAETTLCEVVRTGRTSAVRAASVEALSLISSEAALEMIILALRDESHSVRWEAVKALRENGSRDAVDALVSVLADEGSAVESNVIDTLGRLGAEDAVDALVNIVGDEDAERYLRGVAAEALGKIESDRAVGPLLRVLRACDSGSIRQDIIQGLGGIASAAAVEALEHGIPNAGWDVVEALRAIGSERAEQELRRALNDKEELDVVRGRAALGLGEIGSPRALEALITTLGKEQSACVRREIVYALGYTHSPDAIDTLVGAVGDVDWQASVLAGLALMPVLGGEVAITTLVDAIEHPVEDVRRNVPQVLAWLGSKSSAQGLIDKFGVPEETVEELRRAVAKHGVDLLMRALGDRDAVIRAQAADALGDVAPRRAADKLINALKDENALVRQKAAEALGKSGLDQAVVPLIDALSDPAVEARNNAARALGEIGSDRAERALVTCLADEDEQTRSGAAKALAEINTTGAEQAVIGVLDDQECGVRLSAAMTLGKIGSEKAVDKLIARLADADGNVRWWAAMALGKIGSERAVESLVRAMGDPDMLARRAAVYSLGQIGSAQAVEPLLKLLDDEDKNHRGWAAEALGMIGDERAVDALIGLLDDRAPLDFVDSPTDVGDRAADALGMIDSNRILPILTADLTGNSIERCRGAQKALMRIKPEGVVKALVDALGDERGWAGHLLGTYHLEHGETVFNTGRVAKLTDLCLKPELFARP